MVVLCAKTPKGVSTYLNKKAQVVDRVSEPLTVGTVPTRI